MRVLIVGNENGSARTALTTTYLNMIVDCTGSSADEVLPIIDDVEFDLVLIEVGPHTPAARLVQRLRLAQFRAPILLLSPIDHLTDTVQALSAGADDYITLPFDPESLIERCFAISEGYNARTRPVLAIGRLRIDIERRTLHVDGTRVHLTHKEFQMLELLAINQGALVTKNMFFKHIYAGRYEPVHKVIDVFINKLRKKLGGASGESYIETIWARGYILRAPEAAINGSKYAASA